MARTFIRQATQIRRSDTYDDTIAPTEANFETNPTTIEDDLNSLRSMASELRDGRAGNWWDALVAPVTFESGAIRGVQNVNQDLHDLERKRVLRCVWGLDTIAVPGGSAVVILGAADLPGNTTAAVGAVTTLGTVVAQATTFGTAGLDEVAGPTAISPKNLVSIVDASTRDPILDSSGRVIYGLLQTENGTDGHTITATTPNRAQLSFVVVSGNDLVLAAGADIGGKSVDYCYVERIGLEDLSETDFLGGANVDVPSGSTVTRQVAYDNQGTTPVDLTTNATLDLEGAGLAWAIRDDLEANLLRIVEGSAGGTSEIEIGTDVDLYDNNAADVDFSSGVKANTGGTRPIHVGATDGVIETTAGDLRVFGFGELFLDDGNQPGSWAQTDGVKLSETSTEWSDYETAFGGEVSLLNAIVQAYNNSARVAKTYANVTVTTVADNDVGGSGGGTNLDAQLPDLSLGAFLTDYDVFLNGELLRPGANAAANNDYYPGTSLALGQLKFEFTVVIGDVIAVIAYA